MNPSRVAKINRYMVNGHFQKVRPIVLENGLISQMSEKGSICGFGTRGKLMACANAMCSATARHYTFQRTAT
ncbi:hypothetical protein PR048_026706 [Dryococelus australis]|uniref:Ribosomal protein S14 n=1 Tax=Dryococelus australis TaxID=614101 RepID=A0ABQ9GM43_9NEOP|nr:hypothetical protein PR048_026706 [Dryococelus australis]